MFIYNPYPENVKASSFQTTSSLKMTGLKFMDEIKNIVGNKKGLKIGWILIGCGVYDT